MLPLIDEQLVELERHSDTPYKYGRGKENTTSGADEGEYWDDLALARFLKGVCLRYVAYPVSSFGDFGIFY